MSNLALASINCHEVTHHDPNLKRRHRSLVSELICSLSHMFIEELVEFIDGESVKRNYAATTRQTSSCTG